MILPPEDALAFFPPAYSAGRTVVRPLTLAGAVLLSEAGVDIGKRVPTDKIEAAAKVLAALPHPHGSPTLRCDDLETAVSLALNDAFETYLRPLKDGKGTVRITPDGLGWPLELAEFLCAEYGWSFDRSAATPVATAFALVAAAMRRNRVGHSGFDYVERQYARDIKSGKVKPAFPVRT